MSRTRHFADELVKLSFAPGKGMPVLTSALSKSFKGAVPKPLSLGARVPRPTMPKPPKGLAPTNKVPGLKNMGTKMDPARKNPPPPPVGGGTNVQ